MKESNIFEMLWILKNNGSIMNLIDRGFEFGQLASFIDYLVEYRYIKAKDNIFEISKQGEQFLKAYQKENNIRKYSKWIELSQEKWKKPIGKYDYIPW